jgi:para-aminobenzoate synthetase component 2
MDRGPSILVVDNYDSFVYNLVQYLGELGATVTVLRNDQVSASDMAALAPDGVLISPGPGHPRDAGNCLEIIRYCADHRVAMLGVCLGHQALGEAFGATVARASSSTGESASSGASPTRWSPGATTHWSSSPRACPTNLRSLRRRTAW